MATTVMLAGLPVLAGCDLALDLDNVVVLPPTSAATVVSTSDKLDVLFVIDNAPGMYDKQRYLAASLRAGMFNTLLAAGVRDIRAGVISSSLGGLGSDGCSGEQQDEGARLLRRGIVGPVATYRDQGFLAYHPTDPDADDFETFINKLEQLVEGVGEQGCRLAAPLEAARRFLVDPAPYAGVAVEAGVGVPFDTDEQLLAERSAFVRPDSILAVVLVSDRNDCSLNAAGQGHLVLGSAPMPMIEPQQDPYPLRCFDPLGRFGIDAIQPIDRYIDAFSATSIEDGQGGVAPNPLFSATSGRVRSPEMVLLTGMIGVNYELVYRRIPGTKKYDHGAGAFTALEMEERTLDGEIALWDHMLDPAQQGSNFRESIEPRAGMNLGPQWSPPVGHDRFLPNHDDLQYVCVGELLPTWRRECSTEPGYCECGTVPGPLAERNPTCRPYQNSPDQNPNVYSTTQYNLRAYPGLRQLAFLRAFGSRGVVGSVCVKKKQEDDPPDFPDFGYQPPFITLGQLILDRYEAP